MNMLIPLVYEQFTDALVREITEDEEEAKLKLRELDQEGVTIKWVDLQKLKREKKDEYKADKARILETILDLLQVELKKSLEKRKEFFRRGIETFENLAVTMINLKLFVFELGDANALTSGTATMDVIRQIYFKYGGRGFGLEKAAVDIPKPSFKERWSSKFDRVFRELSEDYPNVITGKGRIKSLATEPFATIVRIYIEWLNLKEKLQREKLKENESILTETRKRLSFIQVGRIAPLQEIEEPYRHDKEWVSQPENLGSITVNPVITTAISDSFDQLLRNAPHITKPGLEFLQSDPVIRGDFAELVAANISVLSKTSYKTYSPKWLMPFSRLSFCKSTHFIVTPS